MTFVNQPGPPQVNPRDLMLQSQHDPMSTANKFDSVLNTAGGLMNMFGPVGGLLSQKFGGNMGAAVTSSVLSGFQNGSTPGYQAQGFGASGQPAQFTSSYGPGKMLTMPGAPPGYPGSSGGSLGAPPGYPGGSSAAAAPGGMNMNANVDPSQFDSNINSMMNNNLVFLAIQTKVQNVSQTTQLMSNIFKADSDAKLNAIRNVRG